MLPRYVQRVRAVQIYLVYTIILSGLICGTLQAFIFPLSLLSRRLWLPANQWLAYSPLALMVFCAEVLGRVRVRVFGDHAKVTQLVAGELGDHLMVSLNHVGDIDWLIGFCLLDRMGTLGKLRALAKDIIKFIPGVGWSFYFSDWIFVKRDASRDLAHISYATKKLATSPCKFVLAILPEGTRFTPEKQLESKAIAAKKGLPVYKHHLTPRTRGFHALTACLREDTHMLYLVDITILTPEHASVGTVLSGEETVCDAMLSFHPLSSIPETERESGEWLYQLFRDKDEQVEYHRRHGLFPGTPVGVELPSRCRYYSLFWMTVSLLPPLSLGLYLAAGELYSVLLGCVLGVWVVGRLLDRLLDLTKIHKASKYGTGKQT